MERDGSSVADDAQLIDLLDRAARSLGRRVPTRGSEAHKGRVGDGVERLVLGRRIGGQMEADHPAAEVKSVPVLGERVIERVKLGVVSERSNPLEKCERVLFVFVERRGRDHFVVGHHVERFPRTRWLSLWRNGYLVETAAGVSGEETRGLYLTPKFFYDMSLWPT